MGKDKVIRIWCKSLSRGVSVRYEDSFENLDISELLHAISDVYYEKGESKLGHEVEDVSKHISEYDIANDGHAIYPRTTLGNLEFRDAGSSSVANIDIHRSSKRPISAGPKMAEKANEPYRGETTEFKAPFKYRIDEIFHDVAKMGEVEVFNMMLRLVKKHGYLPVVDEENYIYAGGNIPIILNAHVDTVFDAPPKNISIDKENEMLLTHDSKVEGKRIGLGADDRSGVAIIASILEKGHMPGVIITRDEERGNLGAIELVKKYGLYPDTRYIIGLDRKGNNDAVFYGLSNTDFMQYITGSFGFEKREGSSSDVSVFGRAWNAAIVNLSTGYENAHSEGEVQSLRVLRRTADRVVAMIQAPPEKRYTFTQPGNAVPARESRPINRSACPPAGKGAGHLALDLAGYGRKEQDEYLRARCIENVVPDDAFLAKRLNLRDRRNFKIASERLIETFWWARFDFEHKTYTIVPPEGRSLAFRYVTKKPINVSDMEKDGFFDGMASEVNLLEDMVDFVAGAF